MIEDRTPSLAGSSDKDSPNLTGWGNAALSGLQETTMESLYEQLRKSSEPPHDWEGRLPKEARTVFYQAMGEWVLNDIHGLWLPPESEDGHSPESMARVIAERVHNLGAVYDSNGTESPIEDMMAGALVWVDCDWAGMPEASFLDTPQDQFSVYGPRDQIDFYLSSQATVGEYRADFLLWFSYGKHSAGVAIECDGHDFHEKTKEQAARDKKRDRALLTAGFPVARFTGSEIFKDPLGCRDQVREMLSGPLDRISKAAGLY